MENNEDNRQMTVIAEAIKDLKDQKEFYDQNDDWEIGYRDGLKYAMDVLKSLLPKE